jgi:hypothetical protein
LCEDTITKKIYKGVLDNIRIIHTASRTNDNNVMNNFFVELIKAIKQNIKQAGLWDRNTVRFLNKIERSKKIFLDNATGSLAHKDLTAGNIIIDKNGSNLVRFIDPRNSLPYLKKSFPSGNISVDIIGYYITILRKEMEHKKLFGDKISTTAKKIIRQELNNYKNEGIVNGNLLDLTMFFWYSVYLACKCEYCTSKKRKWLYDEMKIGYDKYTEKIKLYIQ